MQQYKDMYLKLERSTEQAIRILTQAQQEAEEMYLSAKGNDEPEEGGSR